MDTLRIGVIGVGVQGIRHARVLKTLYGCELAGVSDIDHDRGLLASRLYKCLYYPDFNDLLPHCDAVVVAVPTPHHAYIATQTLSKGIPTLLEKPIAGNLDDATAILQAAKKTPLMVGHIERFNPAVRALKQIIPSLHLLQINAIRHNPPFNDGRTMGVGVTLDLMIHDIDVVRYLVGIEPKEIYSVNGKNRTVGVVTDKRGYDVVFSANMITQRKIRRLEVFAEEEYIELDYIEQTLDRYRLSRLTDNEQKVEHERVGIMKQEPLRVELDNFADCIREGKEPEVNGLVGLENLKLALAMA